MGRLTPMGFLFLPHFYSRAAERQGFDPRAEQALVAEAVVRSAASLVDGDDDAQALIERHCQALTLLAPHIVLAWTWFGPPRADTLRPQAVAGTASRYARTLVIQRNLLTAVGPAFRTLAGARLEPFNVSTASLYGPWRYAAREHGVKSVLALPLASQVDDQRGLFVLYSDVPRYFDLVGVGLFEALAQLFSAVLSRAVRNTELARAAHRDSLTGLPNRGALTLLEPTLRRLGEHDPPVAVLMLDIDHFKRINDEQGHDGGDAALRHVAQRLQALLRQGDTLVRWGGEEFCLCLRGVEAAGARAVAEKLRAGLAAEAVPLADGAARQITASLGVAMLRPGEPLAAAVGRADQALYVAKRHGRNRVETLLP
jgi:diguanylate cyclase (GGDEF)-like protein